MNMTNSNELTEQLNNTVPLPLAYRYYSEQELVDMPITQLKKFGLYPDKPEPAKVETLADLISDHVDYQELDEGVLGMTQFIYGGKPIIFFSDSPVPEDNPSLLRRFLFTVAHECGHIIMQDSLFQQGCRNLIRRNGALISSGISCHPLFLKEYNSSNWYEWQANTAAAHLLMPPEYLHMVIQEELCHGYIPSAPNILHHAVFLEQIYNQLKVTFNVNYSVAKIATERYLKKNPRQYANLLNAINYS